MAAALCMRGHVLCVHDDWPQHPEFQTHTLQASAQVAMLSQGMTEKAYLPSCSKCNPWTRLGPSMQGWCMS